MRNICSGHIEALQLDVVGFILHCICYVYHYCMYFSTSEVFFLILFCSCSFDGQQQTVTPLYECFAINVLFF